MSKCTMLAIDGSSTATGYAVYVNGKLTKHHGHIDHPSKDPKHFEKMCEDLIRLLNQYRPQIVVMEDPPFARRNPNTLKILSRLVGVVYGWCLDHDCEFNLVNVATWHKAVHRDGEVIPERDREALKEWSKKRTGADDDNEADAILIGEAWLYLWNRIGTD